MLAGNKFTENIYTLRLLTEGVLHSVQYSPQIFEEWGHRSSHTVNFKCNVIMETTYMQCGQCRSGIIGLTLKPKSLQTWSYSLHTCSDIVMEEDKMRDD